MTEKKSTHPLPGLAASLIPLFCVLLLIGIGLGYFHLPAAAVLLGASVIAGFSALTLGYSYKEMEQGIVESMGKAMPAMLIVISVGGLIASWIAAGTIPMLVYYGLKLISPRFYLLTACLVCSLVSVVTGTSYGSAGTVGIAFIGIAQGLGVPLGQAAGAIVAGAYFGDKLSPFSDTTNLAPAASQSNLFDHIRHTMWTTVPAWSLGLLIYLILGFTSTQQQAISMVKMDQILATLSSHYRFHWLLLLPPLITLTAALRKKSVIPYMLLSSAAALLLAAIFQGYGLSDGIKAFVEGYKAQTGDEAVNMLLSRGGMMSMMDVTLIAFAAFAFGGIMQKTGMLDTILRHILRIANTTGKLVAATVLSSISVALITGSSFLAILLPAELYAGAFKKFNLAAKNLSRTTEDSGAVVVPLIPWSMAGIFMSGTLGVPTLEYAPWAVMCYSGFIFALIYGFTGFALAPRLRDDETLIGS